MMVSLLFLCRHSCFTAICTRPLDRFRGLVMGTSPHRYLQLAVIGCYRDKPNLVEVSTRLAERRALFAGRCRSSQSGAGLLTRRRRSGVVHSSVTPPAKLACATFPCMRRSRSSKVSTSFLERPPSSRFSRSRATVMIWS